MSGGVDSSVAAYLLKIGGFDCSGAMMKLFEAEDEIGFAVDARAAAELLEIPFCVLDHKEDFAKEVLDSFVSAYRCGETPNPCVYCNRRIKFGVFLESALGLGMDCIATGHYARIEYDFGSGRWMLKKGIDETRDQSYFLYTLGQNQLSRALFPLGELKKTEVREIALEQGLHNASKSDSQDICFIPDGKYTKFIEKYTGEKPMPGRFVDFRGNDLGEHKGVIHYTVGQRKGIGIPAEEPLYVQKIMPESNTVVLGGHGELFSKTLIARDINLIPIERVDNSLRVTAKIRYRHKEQLGTIRQLDDDTIQVEFDEPQRAVTRGQAVVFYDGDVVIGGGTIA